MFKASPRRLVKFPVSWKTRLDVLGSRQAASSLVSPPMGIGPFIQLLNPEHQYNAWKRESLNIVLSLLSTDFLFIRRKTVVSKSP